MAESDEAGFTLVEMIVSLAVTALIALLLIQSLQATGLITRNAKRLAAQEEVQLVRGICAGRWPASSAAAEMEPHPVPR